MSHLSFFQDLINSIQPQLSQFYLNSLFLHVFDLLFNSHLDFSIFDIVQIFVFNPHSFIICPFSTLPLLLIDVFLK